MRRSGFVAAAALAVTATVDAQSVGDDFGNVWNDARWVVGAPSHATWGDVRTAGLLAGGTVALAVFADEAVHDWLHSEPWVARILGPFGEHSPLSIAGRTWFFLLPLSTALYAAGHGFGSQDLRDAGLGCATANLTTTLTRTSVAYLIGRDRPGVHRGPFRFRMFAFGGWNERSFPGGHASNIMSCVSYFNHRFDLGLAEPALWATAAGVGLARIVDEAHWTSDTFAGMAYGFGVGRAVAHRFADRRRSERSLQPTLTIGWQITF